MSAGRGVVAGAWALLAACAMVSCESRQARLERIADAAPTAGRAATLDALRAGPDFGAGWVADAALLANDRYADGLDTLHFAAATLDLAREREQALNEGALLLQRGLGLLAFRAADDAWQRGDPALGLDLVFNGGRRWQNLNYWMVNPAHDALASLLLFEAGREQEAIERIADRAMASEVADAALRRMREQAGRRRGPAQSTP